MMHFDLLDYFFILTLTFAGCIIIHIGGCMEQFDTKVKKINENIYVIDQEMVRAYVIVGREKALCFDFGVAVVDFEKYLLKITDLSFIYVLSHSDPDHVANIFIADKVYVFPDEIEMLKDHQSVMFSFLKEGQVFDLGGVELEVVHTPGHTPGSISLLWRKAGILFSGDTISYGPVYMFGPARDLKTYKNSLKKLLRMAENDVFTEIYPAHNLFPIGQDAIEDLIAVVEEIESGKAVGIDPCRSFFGFKDVKLFSHGKCGIFF